MVHREKLPPPPSPWKARKTILIHYQHTKWTCYPEDSQLGGRLSCSTRSRKYDENRYGNRKKGLPPKDVAELREDDEKAWRA